jgi:N-methylhydantoinase B
VVAAQLEWDGVRNPYLPPDGWREIVESHVDFHREVAEEINPITYEVIRHNLWTINQEHGQTLSRLSGSPTACVAHDFNPAVCTELGEEVFFGPYIQHLAAGGGSAVRWILQHMGRDPGIGPGDAFVENDPWIGANHQSDIFVIAPVTVDGAVFCWVLNSLHHYDLGGSTPGSFCPDAVNIHMEATPMPPMKLVDRGHLREDIERMILRQSRVPELVALDLHAQLAGVNVARRRIEELIARYGAPVVKAAMEKVINDAEQACARRLRQIPDGVWTDVGYLEECTVGDRHAYRTVLTVEKHGDTMTFSNSGTDPQAAGSLNCTLIGWKGAITAALLPVFCFDQLFAVGGCLRRCEFDPTPGTLTCARWPAPVSCAPIFVIIQTIRQTNRLMTKMAFSSEELRAELGPGGVSGWPLASVSGRGQWGQEVAADPFDLVAGAIGPYTWRDGVSGGGHEWIPLGYQPNVEHSEHFFPLLYLYRKLRPNSGGAGKYRGGNSASVCYMRHGTQALALDAIACSQGVPNGAGVFGGYPAAQTRSTLIVDSDVREGWLAAGRMPADFEELSGERERLPGKGRQRSLGESSVYELTMPGAPGYGDPLDREVERVVADVAENEITRDAASEIYGVVLSADGLAVDAEATERRRAELRRERCAGATSRRQLRNAEMAEPDYHSADGSVWIHEYLEVILPAAVIACYKCGHIYCSVEDNYKLYALERDEQVVTAGKEMNNPADYVDDAFVWRRYFCPGCYTLVETEIARPSDAPVWDIKLGLEAFRKAEPMLAEFDAEEAP